MEVRCCGDGWGQKPCLMGTDGDGYNWCGNGWGLLNAAGLYVVLSIDNNTPVF